MIKSLVTAILIAAAILPTDAPASPEPAAVAPRIIGPVPGATQHPRSIFYCQPPSLEFAVNASTAFESEVCDDLPDSLVGRSIGEVTLYATEWGHHEWVDPLGVAVRFYYGSCPPGQEPIVEYSISWDELATSVEYTSPPMKIIYAVTAALPQPMTVTQGMSMGAYVITDWPQQPYTGLTLTAPDEYYGCGELYWDDELHGATRWTPLSWVTGIEADLAFCLAEQGTGIQEEPSSWGKIKSLFR